MRIRVCYSLDVDDDYRRAINLFYGRPGLATRAQVKDWARSYGSSGDDDLMWDLQREQGDALETQS